MPPDHSQQDTTAPVDDKTREGSPAHEASRSTPRSSGAPQAISDRACLLDGASGAQFIGTRANALNRKRHNAHYWKWTLHLGGRAYRRPCDVDSLDRQVQLTASAHEFVVMPHPSMHRRTHVDNGESRGNGRGPTKVLLAFLSALIIRFAGDWFSDWRKRHGL